MTPLKALILNTLKQDGPLSDLGIHMKIGDQETGGLAAMVVIACLELHSGGFIETCPSDRNTWQLSNKGLDFVAALRGGYVPREHPMPPVEITPETPPVMRRYLVLEIRGGDEKTAKSWYGIAELEFEHMTHMLPALLVDSPQRARRNPPEVILHRPTEVEA